MSSIRALLASSADATAGTPPRPEPPRTASESSDSPSPPSEGAPSSNRKTASKRIIQNCDQCRTGRNKCDRRSRCGECRMRGRVCTYGAAGPDHGKTGSVPLEQNHREIERLKAQVGVLVKVLKLDQSELLAMIDRTKDLSLPSPLETAIATPPKVLTAGGPSVAVPPEARHAAKGDVDPLLELLHTARDKPRPTPVTSTSKWAAPKSASPAPPASPAPSTQSSAPSTTMQPPPSADAIPRTLPAPAKSHLVPLETSRKPEGGLSASTFEAARLRRAGSVPIF
ncbi:hypothetical protein JCM10207_003091 [Rhodosporidiobolus poonsookiae]